MRGEPRQPAGGAAIAAIAVLLASVVLYLGAYVAARASHALVHRAGGSIAGPDWAELGTTPQEVVFVPLILLETTVRSRVDPFWDW